ncbi:MAG: hypothetical protein AAGH64_02635 [Planctomycetota bacterium]
MADRQHNVTAHAVIALALVGAAQMLFVSPAREAVADARRSLDALENEEGVDRDPTRLVSELERRERDAYASIARIEIENEHADPARLVDLIQRFGDETGVVIQRIDPKTVDPRSGMRSDDGTARAMPTSGVVVTIEARGAYASVARFVGALEGRPGFVRTEEVNIRPALTPGSDSVGVTIRTAQLAFDPGAFEPSAPQEGTLQ